MNITFERFRLLYAVYMAAQSGKKLKYAVQKLRDYENENLTDQLMAGEPNTNVSTKL